MASPPPANYSGPKVPPHLRGEPREPISYVPAHLRGIDPPTTQSQYVAPISARIRSNMSPEGFSDSQNSHNVLGSVAPQVKGSVMKAPTKLSTPHRDPITRPPMNPNTEGEDWARQMGLLKPKPSTKLVAENVDGVPKMGLLPESIPAQPAAPRNTEMEDWARAMGLLLKPAAPAKQAPKVSENAESPGSQINPLSPNKVEEPPRPQQIANPFKNKHFHLKEDSNDKFSEYVNSSATNGRKYVVNAPASRSLTVPSSSIQQEGAIYNQQTACGDPSDRKGKLSISLKVENKTHFGQPDPQATLYSRPLQSPDKKSETAVVRENRACRSTVKPDPWPSPYHIEQSAGLKSGTDLTQSQHMTRKVALTQDALVKTTGFKPRSHEGDLEEKISDDGVIQSNKEGIRATQGVDAAEQLLDWDGVTWIPPPVDWEYERAGFDDSFIPAYIKEWQIDIPCGPSVTIEMDDVLLKGKHTINNGNKEEPIKQPDSIPDIANCVDEVKRTHQTAYLDANNALAKVERQRARDEHHNKMVTIRHNAARAAAMANDTPEVMQDPFAPKIDLYVRPAQAKDAEGIMDIYNRYVASSIIPEDQEPLTAFDVQCLIDGVKKDKLPFVVAVKGRLPANVDAQGRPRSAKVSLPKVESVIGFSFAERFNYGFSGSAKGRSRTTVSIQLYVHPGYTRKGVGQNTLDQLIHCIAFPAYAFRNGCDWVNPERDPVHEPNGCGAVHQMIMQVPVWKKDDPNFEWLRRFLYNKFWFKTGATLISCARSSVNNPSRGRPHMLDLVILQSELLHEDEFNIFT